MEVFVWWFSFPSGFSHLSFPESNDFFFWFEFGVFSFVKIFMYFSFFFWGMGGTGNFDRHCVFGVIFNLGVVRLIIKEG